MSHGSHERSPGGAARQGATRRATCPARAAVNRHVVVVFVNDRPGVLNRVASLARARNFNIESLVVGSHRATGHQPHDHHPPRATTSPWSRWPSSCTGWSTCSRSRTCPTEQLVEHELALVKVRATNHNRAEVLRIIELYKGRVIDVSPDSLIVEHSGTEQEIDSLVALLGGFGIRELVRTGTVAMARGSSVVDIEAHPARRYRAGAARRRTATHRRAPRSEP